MPELFSRSQADLAFGWVVPALICLGAAVIWKTRRAWAVLALLGGGAMATLWRVFNSILDRTGPDSIAGLALCAGLFVAVGVGIGFIPRKPA